MLGNPRMYWNFLDESLNSVLAKVASGVKVETFYKRLFVKFELAYRLKYLEPASQADPWPNGHA